MLEFLLSAEFPGCAELRAQVGRVEVVADCDCGCGTVDFVVKEPLALASSLEPVPVEAYGKGLDVMLFVREGVLSSLEIVDHGDSRPLPFPTKERLELWVPPGGPNRTRR